MVVMTMGVVTVGMVVMPVRVGFRRMSGVVVVTVRRRGVIVVTVSVVVVAMCSRRMRVMTVIGMAVVRGRGVFVMTVAMGVRGRMGGVIVMPVGVMPMRVRRGGGVVVVTCMAVVVVRLVLVAHLGLSPSRCSAVIAAKSV